MTRVNWLVRQLAGARDDLRIEAFVRNGRGSIAAELLGPLRPDPSRLVVDPTKEIKAFRVAASTALGTKRGAGRGGFIDSVHGSVDSFYEGVVQKLRARPMFGSAPALRPAPPEESSGDPLTSVALSSQDDPDAPSTRTDARSASRGDD